MKLIWNTVTVQNRIHMYINTSFCERDPFTETFSKNENIFPINLKTVGIWDSVILDNTYSSQMSVKNVHYTCIYYKS
jgi:hypothetical protein